MLECKKKNYILENAEIVFEYKKDSIYEPNQDSLGKKDTIKCYVEMYNCKLPSQSFTLNGLVFKKYVFFTKCELTNMNVTNCEFNEGIEILWGNMGLLIFKNTIFNDVFETFEVEIPILQFDRCTFNVKNQKVRSYVNMNEPGEGFKSIFNIASPDDEKRVKLFSLDSCEINSDSLIPVFNIRLANFNALSFTDIDFKNTIINFSSTSIDKSFVIEDCKINQPIGMSGFNFPEKGTNFHWNQIEKAGIAIYNANYKEIYAAENDSQLQEINKYNELVSSYKQMYSTYRTRGDMESANNCYIAMKDVETRRLEYLYREKRNLTSYFNWKLNQFLKFFCKYGTSPIRALIISMWVIFGFALIYFFFDSEWDKINREYLLNRYKALLSYFQSDKKLADYYAEKYDVELGTYNEFKEYLKSSEGNIPKYMFWLGKPLYRFPTTRRMLTRYIYSKN
ncbi:MAG: hypothetical protein HC831_28525 [Chloroflexia bacterium]|nr:hypothetical protein [Chloroflexia bacterium]